MASASSLPLDGGNVFDFSSQEGMMHVLASIRASEISTAERSELRDLVLLYMNGGQDESVLITLEKKLTGHNVKPVARKPVKRTANLQRPTIGTFRTTPTFTLRTKEHSISAQEPQTVLAPAWSAKKPDSPTTHTLIQSTSDTVITPTADPVQSETVSKTIVEQPTPIVTTPEIISTSNTPTSTINQPQVEPMQSPEANEALVRIREIKASVNEKVGNPVNLVDINNEVGREYMAALLDAMKKLNTGSSVASALQRLEDSYAAVLHTLESRTPTVQTSAASQVEHSHIPAAPTTIAQSTQLHTLQSSPQSSPSIQAPTAAPVPVDLASPQVPTAIGHNFSNQVTPSPTTNPSNSLPVTSYEEPVKTHFETPVTTHVATSVRNIPVTTYNEEAVSPAPLQSPTPHPELSVAPQPQTFQTPTPPSPTVPTFSSLADLKEVGIPSREEVLRSNQLKDTTQNQADPLFAADVTEGLSILLSEWSIFKKSGLFGTGPKGAEHPLFLKMAPMQVPLILAGRFEGATQEIKQSVTDYMNGWRYEQGIIYEQGETFEHYLRRVIRHILNMQKR